MSRYALTVVNGIEARQLDLHRLDDGTNAVVFAVPGGAGLITVGADLFEYISPSSALTEWFAWLFSNGEESQAKPSLIWRNYL